MTALEFLKSLHESCCFQTRQGAKVGKASNRELVRWCEQGAVVINGEKVKPTQEIRFPVTEMVLFPNKPVTLR
jgi:hypothetical protein